MQFQWFRVKGRLAHQKPNICGQWKKFVNTQPKCENMRKCRFQEPSQYCHLESTLKYLLPEDLSNKKFIRSLVNSIFLCLLCKTLFLQMFCEIVCTSVLQHVATSMQPRGSTCVRLITMFLTGEKAESAWLRSFQLFYNFSSNFNLSVLMVLDIFARCISSSTCEWTKAVWRPATMACISKYRNTLLPLIILSIRYLD